MRLEDAEEGEGEGGLAGPRAAHDADGAPGGHREAHALHHELRRALVFQGKVRGHDAALGWPPRRRSAVLDDRRGLLRQLAELADALDGVHGHLHARQRGYHAGHVRGEVRRVVQDQPRNGRVDASRHEDIQAAEARHSRAEAVQAETEPALRRPEVELGRVGVVDLLQVLGDEPLLGAAEGSDRRQPVERLREVL